MSHLERSFRCPKCGGISPVNVFWDQPEVLATLEDDGVACLHCNAEFEDASELSVFGLSHEKCRKLFSAPM